MNRTGQVASGCALVLLLTACGGGEPEASPATPARTTETELDFAQLMADISAAQREAETFQFEMTVESEGTELGATGVARYPRPGAAPDLSMTMTLPPEQGGEIDLLLIDDSLYLQLPPEAGAPTPWLQVRADGTDPISAQMTPLIDQMTSSVDFEQYAEIFATAASVEKGGGDVIDGVDVTEYVVTVDVSMVPPGLLGGAEPEDLPFDEVTYSLWVDGDDLVRRLKSDLGQYGTTDGRIFAFGEPVDLEAPPAAEVTDVSALFEGLSEEELAELFPSPAPS